MNTTLNNSFNDTMAFLEPSVSLLPLSSKTIMGQTSGQLSGQTSSSSSSRRTSVTAHQRQKLNFTMGETTSSDAKKALFASERSFDSELLFSLRDFIDRALLRSELFHQDWFDQVLEECREEHVYNDGISLQTIRDIIQYSFDDMVELNPYQYFRFEYAIKPEDVVSLLAVLVRLKMSHTSLFSAAFQEEAAFHTRHVLDSLSKSVTAGCVYDSLASSCTSTVNLPGSPTYQPLEKGIGAEIIPRVIKIEKTTKTNSSQEDSPDSIWNSFSTKSHTSTTYESAILDAVKRSQEERKRSVSPERSATSSPFASTTTSSSPSLSDDQTLTQASIWGQINRAYDEFWGILNNKWVTFVDMYVVDQIPRNVAYFLRSTPLRVITWYTFIISLALWWASMVCFVFFLTIICGPVETLKRCKQLIYGYIDAKTDIDEENEENDAEMKQLTPSQAQYISLLFHQQEQELLGYSGNDKDKDSVKVDGEWIRETRGTVFDIDDDVVLLNGKTEKKIEKKIKQQRVDKTAPSDLLTSSSLLLSKTKSSNGWKSHVHVSSASKYSQLAIKSSTRTSSTSSLSLVPSAIITPPMSPLTASDFNLVDSALVERKVSHHSMFTLGTSAVKSIIIVLLVAFTFAVYMEFENLEAGERVKSVLLASKPPPIGCSDNLSTMQRFIDTITFADRDNGCVKYYIAKLNIQKRFLASPLQAVVNVLMVIPRAIFDTVVGFAYSIRLQFGFLETMVLIMIFGGLAIVYFNIALLIPSIPCACLCPTSRTRLRDRREIESDENHSTSHMRSTLGISSQSQPQRSSSSALEYKKSSSKSSSNSSSRSCSQSSPSSCSFAASKSGSMTRARRTHRSQSRRYSTSTSLSRSRSRSRPQSQSPSREASVRTQPRPKSSTYCGRDLHSSYTDKTVERTNQSRKRRYELKRSCRIDRQVETNSNSYSHSHSRSRSRMTSKSRSRSRSKSISSIYSRSDYSDFALTEATDSSLELDCHSDSSHQPHRGHNQNLRTRKSAHKGKSRQDHQDCQAYQNRSTIENEKLSYRRHDDPYHHQMQAQTEIYIQPPLNAVKIVPTITPRFVSSSSMTREQNLVKNLGPEGPYTSMDSVLTPISKDTNPEEQTEPLSISNQTATINDTVLSHKNTKTIKEENSPQRESGTNSFFPECASDTEVLPTPRNITNQIEITAFAKDQNCDERAECGLDLDQDLAYDFELDYDLDNDIGHDFDFPDTPGN